MTTVCPTEFFSAKLKYLFTFLWLFSVLLNINVTAKYSWETYHHEKSNNNVNINDLETKSDFPFNNISLSYEDRVNDLVSRLSLDEVILQLGMGGANKNGPAPAIVRLGIKPFQWNNECLRGFVSSEIATCFSQPIGLAATFEPTLVQRMAIAVSIEARAIWKKFKDKNQYPDHSGLNCFAPVINILRHPLWGRNQETYGEDPYLTGVFADHYVRGLQGNNERYIAASATCKHFDVHGGPENIPVSRFGFNAVISDRDWQMTFLPAFRSCLNAGANSVMCSYNAVNGVPNCANKKLLQNILRGELGFKGFIVSDELAIENIDVHFHYTKSGLETAVAAILAGVNLELTTDVRNNRFLLYLKQAVDLGMLSEDLLRKRLKPLFVVRMKLGEFDPDEINPYSDVPQSVVQNWEHRELAATIAAKSFVLLKNEQSFLPIYRNQLKISVVGPFSDNMEALTGDYAATFTKEHFISIPEGLKKLTTIPVRTSHGCIGKVDKNLPKCTKINSEEVLEVIHGQDIVIVTLGTGPGVEAESNDRKDLNLPGKQLELLQLVTKNFPSKKVILLLFHGGPLDISWAFKSDAVVGIISCNLPAQATGEAIFRILSGVENPAARLPMTWPKSLAQVPPITNYSMNERTYRYITSVPLFPFGYGLSYTMFHYFEGYVTSESNVCDVISASVKVQNTGKLFGEEVVQLYMSWVNSSVLTPNIQIIHFKRISLKPKETKTISFFIQPMQRAVWVDTKGFVVQPGSFKLYFGGQQPNQIIHANSNVISNMFKVVGNETIVKTC